MTLDLATDLSISPYSVTESNSGTLVIQSDKAAPSSPGITHTLGTLSFGAATLTIAAGPNVSGGSPAVAFGNTTLNSVHNNTTIFNPTTANMNILGSVTSMALTAQIVTMQLDGTSTGNTITGGISDNPLGGSTALTKANTSTWTLSGASSYTGNTAVSGGTLVIDPIGSIISPTITIAAGATLTVNGSVNSSANLAVSGTANFAGNTGTGSFTRTLGTVGIDTGAGEDHTVRLPGHAGDFVAGESHLRRFDVQAGSDEQRSVDQRQPRQRSRADHQRIDPDFDLRVGCRFARSQQRSD